MRNVHAPMPTSWSQQKYMRHVEEEIDETKRKLKAFCEAGISADGSCNEKPGMCCPVYAFVVDAIIDYAVLKKVRITVP